MDCRDAFSSEKQNFSYVKRFFCGQSICINTMDLAMHDFNGAREYLRRHGVHELFERCVQELVLQRHAESAAINKSIKDVVSATMERKETTAGAHVVFVIGVASELEKHLPATVSKVTLIGASNLKDKPSPSLVAQAAMLGPVAAVNFPRSVSDAIAFESTYFVPKNVILLDTAAGEDESQEFVERVNPVAEYYRATGKLVKVSTGAELVLAIDAASK